MKIIIIGCTHAGTAAAIKLAEFYPTAEITIYERNNNISFLSCGIALYIGGMIKNSDGLFYRTKDDLAKLGIDIRLEHEVVKLDLKNKSLNVKDINNNSTFNKEYDKLILTTGSLPIVPEIEGVTLDNIFLSKNYKQSEYIIDKMKSIDRVGIVGAGYIGVELAEAFEKYGKKVVLIDEKDRILNKYLDEDYTEIIEGTLRENRIDIVSGEHIDKFEGENGVVKSIKTNKNTYEVDMVILCIGSKANTRLVKNQLDIMDDGSVIVDEFMRTSNKDVMAAGDVAALLYNPTNKNKYIPLLSNAVKTGTILAYNINENKFKYSGTQGTTGIKIYNWNIASTGILYESAIESNLKYDYVVVEDHYRPEFMPTHETVRLKLVYEKSTNLIKGAQIISRIDLTQIVNIISACIEKKTTIDELAFMDFFFQPNYSKPWHILNVAGLKALDKNNK